MAIENFDNKQLSEREVTELNKRILLTSGNIIDQIGQRRENKNAAISDADWEDEASGRRLRLRAHMANARGGAFQTTYFLMATPQFAHEPTEFYRYSSLGCALECCDSDWQAQEDVAHSSYCVSVFDYLNSAVKPPDSTNAAIFHGLVAETVLNGDNFKRASRAVDLAARLGGRAVATKMLVKKMQKREPLLDAVEIRAAAGWHQRTRSKHK